ncbi:hypothetical protein EWM64_g4095 [Hericium alpestre]|uniref:Protein UNC80 C-terminal domain-containing protein n=1 Tax=Hericium alpestre TaxID=135208 RepID=A0A4Y9ZZK7_9AGAM|nr:hypothetical protein EWM64_g4095 [Hericium alpestre]
MFSLLASLISQPDTLEETQYLRELISHVLSGACGELDSSLVERDLGLDIELAGQQGTLHPATSIRGEALVSVLIQKLTFVQEYWPSSPLDIAQRPALMPFFIQRLNHCSHALVAFISSAVTPSEANEDCSAIVRLLQTRIMPELDAFDSAEAIDIRAQLVTLAFKILCLEKATGQDDIRSFLVQWYSTAGPWQLGVEKGLQQWLSSAVWSSIFTVMTTLIDELSDELRTKITAFFLPLLQDRMVTDPPPCPSPQLTELLDTISHLYPKIFYKPLFACAAAAKDITITRQLRILHVLAAFLPNFWTRDVEMLLVALFSDSSSVSVEGDSTQRTLSLPGNIPCRMIRSFAAKARFFFALENRVGMLLDAKLNTPVKTYPDISPIARDQVTPSLSETWLSRLVHWTVSSQTDMNAAPERTSEVITKLSGLFIAVREEPRVPHKRRSAFMMSPSTSEDFSTTPLTQTRQGNSSSPIVPERRTLLSTFSKGFLKNTLPLFVAVNGLLTAEDHSALVSVLWRDCLDAPDPELQAPATFLIMQAAEKVTAVFHEVVRNDMHSTENSVRCKAARRIGIMFSWRFQLLSQNHIVDRNHRRPFKLARAPIAFVATDIGSNQFILEEDLDEVTDQNGVVLPLELRKRLSEIGWTEDVKPIDQRQVWLRTPMSLLSSYQADHAPDKSPFPSSPRPPSIVDGSVSDAESSRSGTGSAVAAIKRRAIFVPPVAAVLPDLAFLLFDSDYSVANAARSVLIDFMREDPTLLSRQVLDSLSGTSDEMDLSITVLRAFLHVQRTLPPAMSHLVFNHLTGFLKFQARQTTSPDALRGFAKTVPVLSKLATQVTNFSLREIRRAKVEAFLIPSGALWFPPTAPVGTMFPTSFTPVNQMEPGLPRQLVHMAMIRAAQNMLFLDMLKRNPQDVQAIRKNMSRLVLPSLQNVTTPPDIALNDLIPQKSRLPLAPEDAKVKTLSLILSRSYILLVAQVFRSVPRHLNDRSELQVLLDGLNRTLLAHGDDIGIVAHVIIALLVAGTRFRRIFTSGGGYTLFMAALVKVYVESEGNQGIRYAIEFAAHRFYALHQEAFVFQSLSVIAQVAMLPDADIAWIAKHVFILFSTLKDDGSLDAPDAAGIHDANKLQEREALLVSTAEAKPQAFLLMMRRNRAGSAGARDLVIPDQYASGHLAHENLVRLLLTVIGHDPSIRRAEQFLRLLRYMAPHLYESSIPAQNILRDGIAALGIIFLNQSTSKSKTPEAAQLRSSELNFEMDSKEGSRGLQDPKAPSNLTVMRLDYLGLVAAYVKAGGHFGSTVSNRVLELVRGLLKDGEPGTTTDRVTGFLTAYTEATLIRETPVRMKYAMPLLSSIAPLFKAYATLIDISGILETLLVLARNPFYAKEPSFSRLVVFQYCAPAIEACEGLASETMLFSFRPILIKLLSEAVFLAGVDVMEILERRSPSYDYLADIVFPLVISLSSASSTQIGSREDAQPRAVPGQIWFRLLSYVMRACQTPDPRDPRPSTGRSPSPGLERTKSQEKRKRSTNERIPVTTLAISLQIMKVIIIRATDDLSIALPGIWVHIGTFLRTIIMDGNASFALQSQDWSEPPSPLPSPLLRPQSQFTGMPMNAVTPPSSRPGSPSQSGPQPTFSQPRMIDYLLWSTFEFLLLFRSPLTLQLRTLMLEKATLLDRELRMQQTQARGTNRLSFASVFSKPRHRSGLWSGTPSAETSPMMSASKTLPSDLHLLAEQRQPGYARFASPASSNASPSQGPRIVHLGPVRSPDPFLLRRSTSDGMGGGAGGRGCGGRHVRVKSLVLVRDTYKRIRRVQRALGYGVLLEADGQEGDEEEGERSWTGKKAVGEMWRELDALMEEFHEGWGIGGDVLG